MTDKERQQAAKKFAAYWQERGKEKSEKDSFWLNLLAAVFGVEDAHAGSCSPISTPFSDLRHGTPWRFFGDIIVNYTAE